MKIVITGGAGFIGSNFVRYMVNKYPQHKFINFDKLTYAGNLENLKDIGGKDNYQFIKGDVCDLNFLTHTLKHVDCIFHLAAESHVDNSVGDSLLFTRSNTYGTHVLLEAVRACKVPRFFHISTDEVYGQILEGSFLENSPLDPTNPYSASKAGAEMIVRGYFQTHKVPITIVRGCNNYGPNQYPEKIIPRFITNLLEGKKVPLHGDGHNVRTYIHVSDFCKALDTLFQRGEVGEIYNISAKDEISNLDLTKVMLKELGKDESYIDYIRDRPFNDERYSISADKLHSLGWAPEVPFEEGLKKTIEWYKNNESWWKPLKSILDLDKRQFLDQSGPKHNLT